MQRTSCSPHYAVDDILNRVRDNNLVEKITTAVENIDSITSTIDKKIVNRLVTIADRMWNRLRMP